MMEWVWNECRYEQLLFCCRQESSTWSQPSSTWWQPSPQWEWWVLLLPGTIDGTHTHSPRALKPVLLIGHRPVRHYTAELPERGRTVQGQEIWGGKGSASLVSVLACLVGFTEQVQRSVSLWCSGPCLSGALSRFQTTPWTTKATGFAARSFPSGTTKAWASPTIPALFLLNVTADGRGSAIAAAGAGPLEQGWKNKTCYRRAFLIMPGWGCMQEVCLDQT